RALPSRGRAARRNPGERPGRAAARLGGSWRGGASYRHATGAARRNMTPMERPDVGDRQLDALLERLDRLCDEIHTLNRRLDSNEALLRIAHELTNLNESLQALAYAALGQQGPQVRRRRSA